jgi:hypothetical protein
VTPRARSAPSARALALVLVAAAAVPAAGCAQLLGLDSTRFEPMDASTDAPSLCDPVPPSCTFTTGRSVCGQIVDTGDGAGASLRATNPTGEQCGPDNSDGPCGLTIAALPLTSYFAGTVTGRLTGVIDDCGRYVVHDLDPAARDIAIVIEGTGYRRTASLLLGRPTGPGTDERVEAFAVTDATLTGWAAQLGGSPALSDAYLIRYRSVGGMPLAGEQVAMDGGSPFTNAIGTVPWARYFAGNAAFASIDPAAPSTLETGTALAVFGAGTFSVDGFRPGRRCRIMNLEQVANTLIYVTASGC